MKTRAEPGGYMFKLVQEKPNGKKAHLFCVINSVEDLPEWITKSHALKCEVVEMITGVNLSPSSGSKFYFDLGCFRIPTKGKHMSVPDAKPWRIMNDFEDCFDFCRRIITGVQFMHFSEFKFFWSFGQNDTKFSFHLTIDCPLKFWAYNANNKKGLSQKSFVEFMKIQILTKPHWPTLLQMENGALNSIVDESPYNGARSLLRVPTCYSIAGRILKPCSAGEDEIIYLESFNIHDYLNNTTIVGKSSYEILPDIFSTLTKKQQPKKMKSYAFLDDTEPTTAPPPQRTVVPAQPEEKTEDNWLRKKLLQNQVSIERFLKFRVKNVAFRDFHVVSGNTIVRLKNVGIRKCPVGGELNESDNAWLRITGFCEVYYGCNNAQCKGKTIFVGKLENCHFKPYKYYNDMSRIQMRKHAQP